MNKTNEIEKLIKKEFNSDERVRFLGSTAGNIICILARHIIKASGYGVTSTILMRELRNLGKKDAKRIMEIFKIKERSPENASKILRIIAYAIGLELEIKDGHSLITKCPYGECVKEHKDPFICNVCLEYNKGVIEAVLGPKFTIDKSKYILTDGVCSFTIFKKIKD